jgi:nicotinate dehydrogenase subunit B
MGNFASTRRDFLKGGALVVGFAIAARLSPVFAQAGAVKPVAADEVDSFLAIGADGRVTVYSGKVDLGTGVRTALTQMAAEELDVPLDRVTVIQGDTALTPDQGPTYGSLSLQNGGVQIRQAAATVRKHLFDLASQRLGAPAGDLVVEDGVIKLKSGGRSVSYGELIGGRSFALKLDKDAKTRRSSNWSANRWRGSTSPISAPAALPTCRMSASTAWCTGVWSGRRRLARACRASMRTR